MKNQLNKLRKAINFCRKFKQFCIALIAFIFFNLKINAQDAAPPVLINPSVGCSSLNMLNTQICYSAELNFNGSSLESSVAALYQDPSPPVTALFLSRNLTVPGPGTANCSWVYTYHFKIQDGLGNFTTCDVIRSGQDNTPPTFTVPADFTMYQTATCDLFDPPVPAISGDVVDAADNCGNVSIIFRDCEGRRPGGTYGRGEGCSEICPGGRYIERTWEVYDECGNKAEGIQIINILDNILPVFTQFPQNIVSSSCNNVFYDVTAEDNCNGYVTLSYTLSGATTESGSGTGSGTFFNPGNTLVTITATDECGNARQQSFTVNVSDNIPPDIFAPNIFRTYAADNYGCSIDLGASATDNCQVVSFTNNAPACFPVGTTTVTWVATDQNNNIRTYDQLVTRIPQDIGITINADKTTSIYTGNVQGYGPFGPQSINLTTTIVGGFPPYTYSWSPTTGLSNASIPNPVATPANTTTYTLTVTDNYNNTCNLSITINVLQLSSAVCPGNGNNLKFNVCHIPPGNPSNPQNICIPVSALQAHLTSGTNGHNNCYLGPCTPNRVSTTPGQCIATNGGRGINPISLNTEDGKGFTINISPNPSSSEFLIQVFSKSKEKIVIRIFDINGIVKSVGSPSAGTNYIITGSNLLSGVYMAEVVQGSKRQVVKLVKQ